jgi:hypothetical protein
VEKAVEEIGTEELVWRQAEAGAHFEDGQSELRKLLVVGAHAVLFHRKPHTDPLRMWAKKLIEKRVQARRRNACQQDGAHRLCNPAGQDGLSGNSGVRNAD